MKDKFDEALESIDKLLEEITDTCVTIFVANLKTIKRLDLKSFSSNILFMVNEHCEDGILCKVKDKQLKRDLYEFCINHPNVCFRGEKERVYIS